MGRVIGIGMYVLNGQHGFVDQIYPGMYAMLGAAGVLGGVCRVTISLVVIMFELTGGLQLIVPFMVVCTLAKWVGDYYTIGIYDYIIVIRNYPYLHEPDEVTFHVKANEVMDTNMIVMHPGCCLGQEDKGSFGTVETLLKFLEDKETGGKVGGFPLTVSPTDLTFLGYIHKDQLLPHLRKELKNNAFFTPESKVAFWNFLPESAKKEDAKKQVHDLSKFVDETVMTCPPVTEAAQLQNYFRSLGLKLIVIVKRGKLEGLITKKLFIESMEEIHKAHDHGANDPEDVNMMRWEHRLFLGKTELKEKAAELEAPLLDA